MIPFLLSLCATLQVDDFSLDRYLASQNPPSLELVLERLGPVPKLDDLLDPDRPKGDPLPLPSSDDSIPQKHVQRLEEIAAWSKLVTSERAKGDHEQAALWAAKQASERQALLRPRHPLIASSFGTLSYCLYNLNRNLEARDMTLAALDIQLDEYGRLNSSVRESLVRLSNRCERLGDGANGERALRHALDIAILCDGATSPAAARLQSNLASILTDLGRPADASQTYARSLEIYEELDGPNASSVAILCANMAQTEIRLGRTGVALDLLTRAVDIHRALDQLDSRAGLVCLLVMSDLCPPMQALEYMEEAMDIAEKVLEPDDSIWPTALNKYGWGLVQARELEAAEPPLRRALEIQTERYGQESAQVADVLNNLSGLMKVRGQTLEALELFKQSFAVKRKFTPRNHLSLIIGWNNLAVLHSDLRQFEEAEEAWRQGLELCLELLPAEHEDTARLLTNYGTMLYEVQRFEESEAMLRDAVDMRRSLLGNHPSTGSSESSLAQTLFALGQVDEADELLNTAEQSHRADLGAHGLGLPAVLRIRTSIQRSRNDKEAAYRTSREAFEMIDAQKEQLVGTPSEEALFAEALSHGNLAALHAATIIDLGRPEEAFSVYERARGRMLLDLLDQRRKAQPQWQAATVVTPKQIQGGLQPGEQIRAYFWSNQCLLIYDVGPEVMRAEVRVWGTGNMTQLGKDIDRYAQLLADPENSEGQEHLGQRLVATLWPESTDDPKRWIILPDGPLQTLPFEALPRPGNSQPEFVYASSSTLYQDRCRLAKQRDPDLKVQLLAVGDPTFSPASGLTPLRATRSEVENAGRLVRESGGESQLLLGAHATLEELKLHASSCTLLHLATHGQPGSPADPLGASLALARGSAQTSDLTLRMLFEDWQSQLPNCDLVVLSACETQKATRVGDSLMALSWGFFYAGAPTVLASLWKVDDRATALLMGRFYENLLNGQGDSKLVALTKAKRWLAEANRREVREYERKLGLDAVTENSQRSSGGSGGSGGLNSGMLKPYSDPAYWAGFVLLGSPE